MAKIRKIKVRNKLAIHAFKRGHAVEKNKKKEQSKRKCRIRIYHV